MTWQKYTLAFRLLSPLHIGWRKTGNLMQTRPYVTGKVLWGALTTRLTRTAGDGADGQNYVKMGEAINDAFRFGYLYPALATLAAPPVQQVDDLTIYYPWSDPHFDYRFLDSQASIALNDAQQLAESGLLHETEFISPYARPLGNNESAPQVYLKGCLFVKTELPDSVKGWQAALNRLQLGGERGYGWGRVALFSLTEKGNRQEEPTVTMEQNTAVWAHVAAALNAPLTGSVEPMVGWERDNQQGNEKPGRHWRLTPEVSICFTPGSKVSQYTTFIIDNAGIWHTQESGVISP